MIHIKQINSIFKSTVENLRPITEITLSDFSEFNKTIEFILETNIKISTAWYCKHLIIVDGFNKKYLQFRRRLLTPLQIPIPRGDSHKYYIIIDPVFFMYFSTDDIRYTIDLTENSELKDIILLKHFV